MSQISRTSRDACLETKQHPATRLSSARELDLAPAAGKRIRAVPLHPSWPQVAGKPAPPARAGQSLKSEWKGLIDDLGTLILAGLCIAGAVIAASTFDGDLQGDNEIIAAILGTFSLFGLLAGLELADRLKAKRRGAP